MASAMDRHRMLKIKHTVEEMGLTEKKIFTLNELETIAKRANAPLIEVMSYLRNR